MLKHHPQVIPGGSCRKLRLKVVFLFCDPSGALNLIEIHDIRLPKKPLQGDSGIGNSPRVRRAWTALETTFDARSLRGRAGRFHGRNLELLSECDGNESC